jgi:hypothetical protein
MYHFGDYAPFFLAASKPGLIPIPVLRLTSTPLTTVQWRRNGRLGIHRKPECAPNPSESRPVLSHHV